MCNCNKGISRPRNTTPISSVLYAVYDGDQKLTGNFRQQSSAEAKRLKLCNSLPEPCTLTVEIVS